MPVQVRNEDLGADPTDVAKSSSRYLYPLVPVNNIANPDSSRRLSKGATQTMRDTAKPQIPQSDGISGPYQKMMVTTDADPKEEEGLGLHEDVFTIFFLSKPCSKPLLYSIVVIALQMTIYGLLLYGLVEDNNPYRDKDNSLKIPAYVDNYVMVAQVIALLIAVVTQDDVMYTIELIRVGYDPAILASHPSATHFYWVVSCILRFIEGVIGVGIAFIFIVQSSSVLDIFLNFAAVEFVATLDDIGFNLATSGLIGRAAQAVAYDAKQIKIPLRKHKYRKTRQLVILATVATMVGSLVWIQSKQYGGAYVVGTSCARLGISFPEEFVELSKPLDVTNTQRKFLTTGDHPINVIEPQPLIYPFFSGDYSTANRFIEHRPVYFERGIDDVTSGMFYYCQQDQAWVFTIRAVAEADRPKSDCKFGWLMQSPLTEAFNLEDVGPGGWKIWTESLKTADLAFTCNQCFRDSDCGGVGTCRDRECKCDEPNKHIGSRCQTEIPFCPAVESFFYGESAIEFQQGFPYELVKRNDSPVLLYNRPAFSQQFKQQLPDGSTVGLAELIFYSGTRWFYSRWDPSFLELILEASPTIADARDADLNSFHGYWFFNVTLDLLEISDPTDSDKPSGIKWNRLNANLAIGGAAPYGVAFPVKQDYVCYGKCEQETCGISGECDGPGNICLCDGAAGGLFCEFPFKIDDQYVGPLIQEYHENFDEAKAKNYNYAALYWSRNDTELLQQIETAVAN